MYKKDEGDADYICTACGIDSNEFPKMKWSDGKYVCWCENCLAEITRNKK